MIFMFPYIGNYQIPTDELIFFRGGGQPPTRLDRSIPIRWGMIVHEKGGFHQPMVPMFIPMAWMTINHV